MQENWAHGMSISHANVVGRVLREVVEFVDSFQPEGQEAQGLISDIVCHLETGAHEEITAKLAEAATRVGNTVTNTIIPEEFSDA